MVFGEIFPIISSLASDTHVPVVQDLLFSELFILVFVRLVHQVPGLSTRVVIILREDPVANLIFVQLPVLVQISEFIKLLPF